MSVVVARHRTAMVRNTLSRPLAAAIADNVLKPPLSVFDYGCGRGDDVRNLAALGYTVDGWDPNHRPDARRRDADIVNLGYVINVIERSDERAATLRAAWGLAKKVLIVSSRLTWDARDLVGRPYCDGLLTRTGTFQKFYQQAELATWIETTLGVQAHAAAPGIFYIFREPSAAQQFLASRVHCYRPRIRIDPHALYETHRESLAPLFDFLSDHARPPRLGELSDESTRAIKDAVGSLGRAVSLIRQVTDENHWELVTQQRRSELLIYIGLSRFGRRPRFSQLGYTLAADIRTQFGTYRSACVQADRMLVACGNPTMVLMAARSSGIGKQTPTALYLHRSALAELPPVLQMYEGCARVLSGSVEHANLIKLSVVQPQVSYLIYPRFDRDAHPTLAASVTVNLKSLNVEWRDYSRSDNPPLIHRKEEFVSREYYRRELYSKLTAAEQRVGLYRHPERIGSLRGWEATLAAAGVRIQGHRVVRAKSDGTVSVNPGPRDS